MRVLSLFSGGGLGDYGLELAGMEIVGQVEIDEYCQKILKLRWPNVPKWKDIKKFKWEGCAVDLISGGFPCQPFSVAGKQKGKDDNRNLWPEMFRVISEVKPAWVFAENVRGIVKPYLDTVIADLEGLGYATLPLLIPASAIGANHRRERLWIIAYAEHNAKRPKLVTPKGEREIEGPEQNPKSTGSFEDMANTFNARSQNRRPKSSEKTVHERHENQRSKTTKFCGAWWTVEPDVGRVAHGSAFAVDISRLMCYIEKHGTETQMEIAKESSKINPINKLRIVRIYLQIATAPLPWTQEMENSCGVVPELSCKGGIQAQSLGARAAQMEELHSLQKAILTIPKDVENLWGKELPLDIRKAQCILKVASRVNRIKLLGNGQVCQVVEWIGKRIMAFDKGI